MKYLFVLSPMFFVSTQLPAQDNSALAGYQLTRTYGTLDLFRNDSVCGRLGRVVDDKGITTKEETTQTTDQPAAMVNGTITLSNTAHTLSNITIN